MAAIETKPVAVKPSSAKEGHVTLDQFLAQQRDIDLLRFITCGSVDDGKSTLIGRLLYDAGLVATDHLTERGATRADDRASEAAMEDRKKEGYF